RVPNCLPKIVQGIAVRRIGALLAPKARDANFRDTSLLDDEHMAWPKSPNALERREPGWLAPCVGENVGRVESIESPLRSRMTKKRENTRRCQEGASVEGVGDGSRSHGIAAREQALAPPIPQDETEASAQLGAAFDAALLVGFRDA